MKISTVSVYSSLLFIVMLSASNVNAGSADISGSFSYQTINGRESVRIEIEQIHNNTPNITTGTLYVTLWMTHDREPWGSGYNAARESLTFGDVPTGQLRPGARFTNIRFTTDFDSPPDGTYYVHLIVSQHPDLNTALDTVTFPGTTTLSSTGGSVGGGGGAGPGQSFATALPILDHNSDPHPVALDDAFEDDPRYFRIDIPESGTFSIWSSGSHDTVGKLYDARRVLIAEDDDGGRSGNFLIVHSLEAGTYYLTVAGYNNSRAEYILYTSFESSGGGGGGDIFFELKLEEPIRDEVHGGIGNLRGWALSENGIDRVEMWLNGSFLFEMPYGGDRPDVAEVYPEVAGAQKSGYSMAFGYSNIGAGTHTMTARAYDMVGNMREDSATFSVVEFHKNFIPYWDEVSVRDGSCSLYDDEISLRDVSIDGRVYDLLLKWRTAEQGFEIIEVQ